MMMMISAPSSSFHDYLAMDGLLPKAESLSPIQTNEDHLEQSFDNSNNNNNRNPTVKRPMNAFLLWARGERKRVSSDGYGVSQTSLSKLLGETWRHMSVEEKQPFLDMAEALKRQHHIDHPDYRFRPKQRSTTASKTIAKKNHAATLQQQLSTMISSPHSSSSSSLFGQQQPSLSPASNAAPHSIQPTVLAMCQAILPAEPPSLFLSEYSHNDWFLKLISEPQAVIVVPPPRAQTSPMSSRRAVRIQIINKHDDIALPQPTLLPMTPPPLLPLSSLAIDDSTPNLIDYLANSCAMFNIPTNNNNNQQGLASVIDDSIGYETLHNSSALHFTDLDQPYDGSGWIDTPMSNFGTNSVDMIPSSPYSTYDFLCL